MQKLKWAFFICLILFGSNACVKESPKAENTDVYEGVAKPTPIVSKEHSEPAGGAIKTPTPFIGQKVIFKGENAEIKIESDLKTSLENQEHPSFWFEYKDENEKSVRNELRNEITEIIKINWKTNLNFLYHQQITDNNTAVYESTFSDRMEAINSLNELRQLEIELPENRKRFIDDEIWQLLKVQRKLATERFEELAKHFDQ